MLRSKSTVKRKSAYKELPKKVNEKDIRRMSPNHCENYSDYLYQRGLMIDKLHKQKAREAERAKTKEEQGFAYKPKINEFSKALTRDRVPMMERTVADIENKKNRALQERSKSYKKQIHTSPRKSRKRKLKVVLDPEDYDNFFRKNIEWLHHKENKREMLHTEKKRRQETEDRRSMVPDKFVNSPDYFIDDPLYEDLYNQALKHEPDRGIARVAKRLEFGGEENDDEKEELLQEGHAQRR